MADKLMIPLVGMPDAAECYYANIEDFLSNAIRKSSALVLEDPSADRGIHGQFIIPDIGTITTVTVEARAWSETATGNFNLFFAYKAIANSESADPSAWDENAALGATAIGSPARDLVDVSWTLTAGNFTAGELIAWYFGRDLTDDTLADELIVDAAALVFA